MNIFGEITKTADPVIQAIKPKIDQAVAHSKAITINSDDDCLRGVEALAEWKRIVRSNENERAATVKPFNDGVTAINKKFRENSEELVAAIALLEPKIIDWQERKEREAEEERLRQEAAALEAARSEEVMTGVEVEVAPIAAPVTTFVGKSVGANTTKRWTAETTDKDAVPDKFLIVDQVAVNAEMKRLKELWQANQITKQEFTCGIPGVRIYQKTGMTVR